MNKSITGPLELSEAQMQALVDAAMVRIRAFTNSLDDQPADTGPQADMAFVHSLAEPLPEGPADPESLLDLVFEQAVNGSLNTTSAGFLGYIPGGGLFHTAVADLVADTLNRYVGIAVAAPALVQLEANVIRWFCEIIGLPDTARGFLTSGGSLANLSALVAARQDRLGEDFLKGVIYVSDQTHHCVQKGARLAGFPRSNIRVLETDHTFRLDPITVREEIRKDRKNGMQPFMLVGSAGTTNTGAVDPLDELATLAREEGLWYHVDGAYGGLFMMTERGRDVLRGIEQADSLVLDPHKTLFLPYGTGALLVRDGATLRAIHSTGADYMPPVQDDDGLLDFCELSPELTRPYRGLGVWLPIKMHGAGVFRKYLDEKLDLARWVCNEIEKFDELRILAPPELSILAFALDLGYGTLEDRNAATRRLKNAINDRQRVHVTGTMLHGVFAIRVAVMALRTHRDRLDLFLKDLHQGLEEINSA